MRRSKVAREEIETDQTEFQQFVVDRISTLISGQERIERLVSTVLSQEPSNEVSSAHLAREISHNASSERFCVRIDEEQSERSELAMQTSKSSGNSSEKPAMTKSLTEARWPATLNPEWPRSLKLRRVKDEADNHDSVEYIRSTVEHRGSALMKNRVADLEDSKARSSRWRLGNLMITPTHPFRLVLDLLSVICLCYDLLTIPYFLAWGFEPEGFLKAIQISVMIYWTLDIVASFRTGYVVEGEMITNARKVAARYVRTTFLMEFAIVFVDWLSFLFEAGQDGSTSAKVFRMGKFYRLLRLLGVVRMAKVVTAFHRIANRNSSREVQLALEMFKLLITIVYINHVLGCIWFAISKYAHADTGAHWTDLPIAGGGGRYADTTAFFQYSTAIHWSLTQMTPGSMQINAQNSLERIFNIFCLVFGVLFFSSLISTLSAKMVQIQMLSQAKQSKLSVMMSFLRERNVGPSMSYLIKQQVVERMEAKAPLLQQNVEALRLISGKLQAELHLIVCTPLLATHPVILLMFRLDKDYFTQVCFRAMDFSALSRLDTLFAAGLHCNAAYIISRGSLNYTQRPETALVSETHARAVHSGTWLCEAALWSEWIHVGTAECSVTLEILKINAEQILNASATNFLFKQILSEYGQKYHDRICSLPRATIPTDICDDSVPSVQIISTSSQHLQKLVSCISLEILAETWKWSLTGKPVSLLLQDEVRLGQTILIPISEDNVRRCVHLSCLKLCRKDGSKFVALGKWNKFENNMKLDVKLPGNKLTNYEGPEAALERVLTEKFGNLKDAILVDQREDKTEIQPSPKYLIDTQYTKYMYEATFRPGYELPASLTSSRPLAINEDLPAYPSETTFYIDDRFDQAQVQVYAWVSAQFYNEVFVTAARRADECMTLQEFDIERALSLADVVTLHRGVDFDI